MSIPDKDTLKLYSYSAGLCNFCKKSIINQYYGGTSNMGERGHIRGKRKGSARFINQLEENDTYDNLILLCAEHHKMIDDHPDQYPIDLLHSIKNDHENRIRKNPLIQSNADVSLILHIFKIFRMMDFYEITQNLEPNKLMTKIFDILNIENVLEDSYQADYPFKNPELNRHTKTMFYFLRNLKVYVDDQKFFDIYYDNVGVNYAKMITSDPAPIQEIYKNLNNFRGSFFAWYSFCKVNYGV